MLKNKFFIHGVILAAGAVAAWINPPLIIIWNFGYAVYLVVLIIRACVRAVCSRLLKIFVCAILILPAAQMICILCIPSWIIAVTYSMRNPEYAADLPEYKCSGIPLRNVSYFRNYNNNLFEGDIEEDALLEAACLHEWTLEEITERPETVFSAKKRIELHESDSGAGDDRLEVESGLSYSRFNDGGRGVHVVWDRKNRRLYFFASSR